MEDKKCLNILAALIIAQPIYDIVIYLLNNILNINIPFISFIRPLIAIFTYLYLLFSLRVKNSHKKYSFIYLSIYVAFCLIHIINVKSNFFTLSYGSLTSELRYLFNYGYFLLQFINFYIIFDILNENERKYLLKSIICAVVVMILLYFVSILTNTSPKTYMYSTTKNGWRGWSVSAHYIGHAIIYMLPSFIYALFEKNYIKKWYKYLIIVLLVIPSFYLVGTKATLFSTLFIILFYSFIRIINSVKNKSLDKDSLFFISLSIILIITFKFTFGYSNFKSQLDITGGDNVGIDLISNNLNTDDLFTHREDNNDKQELTNFEDRIMDVLYKYKDIKASVFDNRIIQKKINNYLWKISPYEDKLFGYGRETMPGFTWVETDVHTIFYCYGIIGFIIILVIPIGFVSLNGLKCLINFKEINSSKFLLGFGLGINLFLLYSVGYTMQFAQTVFYLVISLILSNLVFKETNKKRIVKDYLFAINDLNIGGAEVGMVDVVNELVNQGKTVDIVLLRKRGPLLKKVDKNVGIIGILNDNNSKLKNMTLYTLYMLGGVFMKIVYKIVIKNDYKNEIAYLEGYPAVFVASSSNKNSVKIASIRVGLKNHKLKASKLPWGEYLVKKAYKSMDNIYTVSDLTTEEFLDKYPFCKNKTKTIYTYFNLEEMRKLSEETIDYKFDKTKINILAVGRFSEQKSYDRLIEAFSNISKNNNNVLLHFVGKYDTDEGKKILSLIKDNNIEDKVILHGVKSNPYPYIKMCDCLISSSLYEGFPRVINEAIGLGKICIGTNVTGTKEALKDGKLGILVDNSVEGLTNGLLEFINNPKIYNQYKNEINKFDGNKKIYFDSLETLTKKKKNMIIYMPKLSFGGMEKALVNLINYAKLNEKYNLTLYLVYKGDMNYLDLLPKNINLIVACKGKWNIKGKIIAVIKLIMRYIYQVFNSYDIAISYSYQHPILNRLTRLSSENNIVYIHGNLKDAIDEKKLNKRLKRCKYEKFKKIICVSENAKSALVDLIHREDNVFVINNIIDGDRVLELSNEKVDDFKFKRNTIYFINIARHYEQYKRLIRIIEASKKLNEEGYKFEVLFVGDGEDHKLYEDKIKEYGIKNIHLIGKKKNPYKYLKHSSAFVLSSIREGYPVVFIESLILNKPIITTNVSDAKIDIDEKYGIVVDNDDTSIYEGMKKFILNGYEIKNKFDYIEFNKKIEKQVDIIYNKE